MVHPIYHVQFDPEVQTLVWPNGADFDPETLRNWPKYVEAWKEHARLEWHKFIEETYGSLADAPIERGEQGQYETRETI